MKPKLLMARAAAPILSGLRGATSTIRKGSLLEIRVSLQALFVELKETAGFFVADTLFSHSEFDVFAEGIQQRLRVVLDVVQHFANGVALDDGIENDVAVVVETDVDGVGVAEKVVQIAEDLLISAEEERAQNVATVVLEGMQGQRFLDVAAIDELVHLAVGIAGDVAKDGEARRRVVEAMDGHDGKELLHGPAIGHALEKGEVAEVGIGQQAGQALELFGEVVEFLSDIEDLAANGPIEVLGEATLFEREVAEVEEIQSGIERLLRVVVGLE